MDAVELAKEAHNLTKDQKNHAHMCIYNKSNENLFDLFNHYNFNNKDVLSVLASSDQLFSCYVKGAKTVDTFDQVYITLYYYYLRKWLILYKNKLHTPYDLFENNNYSMYSFILNIVPHSDKELEAKNFWKKHLQLNNYKFDKYLFFINKKKYKSPFDNSIEYLKTRLKNNIAFYHLDIAKEIQINKKYDIIILSNILEYINNKNELIHTRNNLESLLNDNGIVICSYLLDDINSDYHRNEIKIITSNRLKLLEENRYFDPLLKKQKDLCYAYQKVK